MKDPKSYFRLISNVTIAVNLTIGVGAIFLVERIVPAIEQILQENALSVRASMDMEVALAETNSASFWASFSEAESNISLEDEREIVSSIQHLGKRYWAGENTIEVDLVKKIAELSAINLKAMSEQDKEARILGLSGAWALGFLVVISVLLQLIARGRVLGRLMEPISDLLSVLEDYHKGNRLRRFSSANAAEEVKKGGVLLNKILDRDMGKGG